MPRSAVGWSTASADRNLRGLVPRTELALTIRHDMPAPRRSSHFEPGPGVCSVRIACCVVQSFVPIKRTRHRSGSEAGRLLDSDTRTASCALRMCKYVPVRRTWFRCSAIVRYLSAVFLARAENEGVQKDQMASPGVLCKRRSLVERAGQRTCRDGVLFFMEIMGSLGRMGGNDRLFLHADHSRKACSAWCKQSAERRYASLS